MFKTMATFRLANVDTRVEENSTAITSSMWSDPDGVTVLLLNKILTYFIQLFTILFYLQMLLNARP